MFWVFSCATISGLAFVSKSCVSHNYILPCISVITEGYASVPSIIAHRLRAGRNCRLTIKNVKTTLIIISARWHAPHTQEASQVDNSAHSHLEMGRGSIIFRELVSERFMNHSSIMHALPECFGIPGFDIIQHIIQETPKKRFDDSRVLDS